MEPRLIKLKTDFNNLITIRNSVKNIFDILQLRIDKLKVFYSEFIKDSKNDMFIFGLDSFHFQSKLIDIEYDDMKRLFLAISNRMYCEYFKLYKIITEYVIKNISDKKVREAIKIKNYPVYKDLEPYKEYNFEIIQDIHENILNLIGILTSMLANKENELVMHKSKQSIGLNIDNFITTFNYNINVIREKNNMFVSYIEFFHKMHTKYLKRFSNKIQLMHSHIDSDIRFDENLELSKDKKRELIENLDIGNLSEGLLNDIKKSMNSETSSEDLDNNSSITTANSVTNISLKKITELFKNQSNRVSNILQNCTKSTNVINANMSTNDITKLFSEIDLSCDLIINDENDENNENNENICISSDNNEESQEILMEGNFFIEDKNHSVNSENIFEAKEDVINELKELIDNQNNITEEEVKEEVKEEVNFTSNVNKKKKKKKK